jgi:YD repeat-containing protein
MRRSFFLSLSAICLSSSFSAEASPFVMGDIFAGIGNGQVAHFSNTGVLKETLNSGQGGFTTGMAFDGDGKLYSTNFSAGNITRYDTNGVILPPNPFASPGSSPESIAFSTSGTFYVGRAGGQVQRYSSTGTLQQTFGMASASDWIDLAADQTTLFFNDEGGLIQRWNVATDTALGAFANNTANGGTASYALRILGNGNVLSAANNIVTQYDAMGTLLGTYDVAGVDGFFALNLDPDGTHFWSGSYVTNSLYRFSIGSFGADVSNQSFATGGQLFGVALAGEITVGGPPPPTVPEPATWAMMLGGFGAIGGAMRSRRRVAVSFG